MEMGVSYIADGVVIILGATIIIVEYVKGEARNKAKADKAAALDAENKAALEARFAELHAKINDIELAMPIMQQVWLYVIHYFWSVTTSDHYYGQLILSVFSLGNARCHYDRQRGG